MMEREMKSEVRTLPHGLTLEDRQKMSVSGVNDVIHFDETQVILSTSQGMLTIRGSDLHVDQLSLDSGELRLTGTVEMLEYDDRTVSGGGLLGRLFR